MPFSSSFFQDADVNGHRAGVISRAQHIPCIYAWDGCSYRVGHPCPSDFALLLLQLSMTPPPTKSRLDRGDRELCRGNGFHNGVVPWVMWVGCQLDQLSRSDNESLVGGGRAKPRPGRGREAGQPRLLADRSPRGADLQGHGCCTRRSSLSRLICSACELSLWRTCLCLFKQIA